MEVLSSFILHLLYQKVIKDLTNAQIAV